MVAAIVIIFPFWEKEKIWVLQWDLRLFLFKSDTVSLKAKQDKQSKDAEKSPGNSKHRVSF